MTQAKSIHLKIASPCNEKPENMDKNDLGSFCHSCTKQVVDFSRMSDAQIIAYFQKSNERVCGQFRQDQLKRYPLPQGLAQRSPRRSLVFGSFISVATALAAGFSMVPLPLQASSISIDLSVNEKEALDAPKAISDSVTVIRGTVIDDASGELVAFAIVNIVGTEIEVLTDLEGYFEAEIPNNIISGKKRIDVLVKVVGYENNLQKVKVRDITQPLKIYMQRSIGLMGEVMIMKGKVDPIE